MANLVSIRAYPGTGSVNTDGINVLTVWEHAYGPLTKTETHRNDDGSYTFLYLVDDMPMIVAPARYACGIEISTPIEDAYDDEQIAHADSNVNALIAYVTQRLDEWVNLLVSNKQQHRAMDTETALYLHEFMPEISAMSIEFSAWMDKTDHAAALE